MEITNNQINHINPYLDIRNKAIFTKSQTVNFQNWNIKNNFIFPFYNDLLVNTDTNAGSTLPENAFKEGFNGECPTNNYPDSNEFMTECNLIKKADTIKASQSILKIYNCMFWMFTNSEETGGAIYVSINGNLSINIQESIHIYKCNFDGMAANKGGAIFISSTESSRLFNVEECRFDGCMHGWSTTVDRDTTYGGAIYIEANSFIVKITKCYFRSNTCGNGAAICFMYESSTSLYDESEISDDYTMLIFDCIFVNNEALNRGGAIYVSIKNGEPSKQIEITKCIFYLNSAKQLSDHKEAIEDNPEEGGVIAFIYEAPAILHQLETKSENTNNFILNVFECIFYQNNGRNNGGCFYIDITDREPTNPIGIFNCSFNNNYGGDDGFDEGDAGDLYYVFKSSTSYKSIKSDSINSPGIILTNDIFTNSHAKVLGGSIVISILSPLASKSIEINSCIFTNCYSSGYSIEFTSSNPSVNLHMIDCKFQKQFSIYFKAVSGLIENCQFINIEGKNPIRYECNSNDNEVGNSFFKIQKCSFLQTNSMDCLVFIVVKSKSNFYFDYNHIHILDTTNKTWLFGCDIDAQNLGNWNFNSNSIFPPEDNFINNENAVIYNFPSSCENGFLCGKIPSSTQEYDNLTGLINITCDKFNHIKNCGECHRPGSASGGSYVNVGGSLSYTFIGTRVHVVPFDQPNDNSGGVM